MSVDNKRGIDVDHTNGSSSDSDEDDNEDPRGKNFNLTLNSSTYDRQYSFSTGLPSYSSRAKSLQPASLRRTEESKVREAAVLLKLPAATNSRFYTSKAGEYLINDNLAERGSILLDVPNGRNELVMAAYYTQNIPKLYPIVGLHKEQSSITLPLPIPLDLIHQPQSSITPQSMVV